MEICIDKISQTADPSTIDRVAAPDLVAVMKQAATLSITAANELEKRGLNLKGNALKSGEKFWHVRGGR